VSGGVSPKQHEGAASARLSWTLLALAACAAVLLLAVVAVASASTERSMAKPTFYLPFKCGQSGWYVHTWDAHEPDVNALDFNMQGDADAGQPVLASAAGVAAYPAYPSESGSVPVAIDHDGGGWATGWASLYLHMKNIQVSNGESVKRGQVIGFVSNVGAPKAENHLHYEQRLDHDVQRALFSNWTPVYGSSMMTEFGFGDSVPASNNSCSSNDSDLNNDSIVNIFDLSILISHYKQTYSPADINHDGTVNNFDLSILLGRLKMAS
jgi:hypothetical protein